MVPGLLWGFETSFVTLDLIPACLAEPRALHEPHSGRNCKEERPSTAICTAIRIAIHTAIQPAVAELSQQTLFSGEGLTQGSTLEDCMRQATAPGVLEGLKQNNATLAWIQKKMEIFLETKRQEHICMCAVLYVCMHAHACMLAWTHRRMSRCPGRVTLEASASRWI